MLTCFGDFAVRTCSKIQRRATLRTSWQATVLAASLLVGTGAQGAEPFRWSAAELYQDATPHQLALNADGTAVELQRGVLIADDGPASGFSYQPNLEKFTADVSLLKRLEVPRPQAKSMLLMVARGGDLQASINGQVCKMEMVGKQGHYWNTYRLDPAVLKAGLNDIVLTGTGQVFIARDDEFAVGAMPGEAPPNHSAKSTDGGKSWDFDHLGVGNDVDGEYHVRLFLDQYVATGSLVSPVLDVSNLPGSLADGVRLDGVTSSDTFSDEALLHLDAEVPPECQIRVLYRSGTSSDVNAVGKDGQPQHWTKWQEARSWKQAKLDGLAGRFFQFQLEFSSQDGLATPRLKSAVLETPSASPADWLKQVRVVASSNPRWKQSCIDFRYEPFDQKRLRQLREQYHLDDVVGDAKTELEIASKLAVWSAKAWPKLGHLRDIYPNWDAMEILSPHADGTPIGGFCQHFNLVFLQACESFGIPGRAISLGPGNRIDKLRGGHEVVEIWSNEFSKWIYVDGNMAWYPVDQATEVPLSLWEMRQRQMASWADKPYPPLRMVHLYPEKHKWQGFDSVPAFVEQRIIPRSNFLEQKYPLPLNQGMRGWFWTGHWVWTDELESARPIYEHRVVKRSNFEWSLNQVRLTPVADSPGVLNILLASNMPHRETYLVTINDGPPREVNSDRITWKLAPGRNRLEVVGRNSGGRVGIPSSVTLDYQAP